MTRKCHNDRSQINPWHHEEGTVVYRQTKSQRHKLESNSTINVKEFATSSLFLGKVVTKLEQQEELHTLHPSLHSVLTKIYALNRWAASIRIAFSAL